MLAVNVQSVSIRLQNFCCCLSGKVAPCRISPPHYLAECLVLLYFVLFCFFWIMFSFLVHVFELSCVLYFPACNDVTGNFPSVL